MILLLACTATTDDTVPVDTGDTGVHAITGYQVQRLTDPDPMPAGVESEFTLQVTDQDGHPIEDLQNNHERIVHTMFVSADWDSFSHVHHEDFYELTVDDLRQSTFHFPLTLPLAGTYRIMYGYAHQNQWLYTDDFIDVTGSPAQAAAPDTTPYAENSVAGMDVSLAWESEAVAGFEATWTVTITEADGTPVDDLVQYLGADAHCALVNDTITWGSHTHAWFPDMANMAPGMEMPHIYTGPDVLFAYTFPTGGSYKMWVQFTRESVPGAVYVVPFVFEVAG